ncbi:MAG: hypothetical protein ACOCW6_07845 [Spirochaetota bacterium]
MIYALGLAFGLINTTLLHLSKGMQQLGIQRIRSGGNQDSELPWFRRPGMAVYTAGFVINNTNGLWLVLGNRFAPPSYMTSMYGFGLLALLWFSQLFLKEDVRPLQYLGAVSVALGTGMLFADGISRPAVSMAEASMPELFAVVAGYAGISILAAALVSRRSGSFVLGLVFGAASGGLAALDPILKGWSQNFGRAGFVPSGGLPWVVYVISFFLGFAAFGITQWGFLRSARATVLVSVHSSVYVILPVALQVLLLPGFGVSFLLLAGTLLVVAGVMAIELFCAPGAVLAQAPKPGPPVAVSTATLGYSPEVASETPPAAE